MLKVLPPTAEIFLIPARAVPSLWGLAHDYLLAALDHSDCEYTIEMLLDECFTGHSQLWLVWSDARGCECAVVTGIIPHARVCLIKACGGKGMQHWLGLLDEIETWAKANGCTKMRLFGREGWRRKLKDYKLARIVLDKELV